MTPKKITSSILKIAKLLIPFYRFYKSPTKLYSGAEDRHLHYKSFKLKHGRMSLRMLAALFTLYAGSILAICLSVPSPLIFLVYIGILPGIADFLTKQAIRGISYWRHHKNPEIIKPTYPQKYDPYKHVLTSNEDEYKKQCAESDETTKRIMQALCLKKQTIKNDPREWSGLSEEQQKQCKILNQAVEFYRLYPHTAVYSSSSRYTQILKGIFSSGNGNSFVSFFDSYTLETHECKDNRMDPELRSSFLDPIIKAAIAPPP